MSNSALYEGVVSHRRLGPVEHRFKYRIAMAFLDLDELPEALDRHPLWSARGPAPIRYRRTDFLGDPAMPLADAARRLVRERLGHAPVGPVRLLSTLRQFGVSFSPVSFLYLYDGAGERVEAMIAQVTNTPWGERHAYVLERRDGDGPIRDRAGKRLHVSPFMGMDQSYSFLATDPGKTLAIRIASEEREARVFEAALHLHRRHLDRRAMSRALTAFPANNLVTVARIYAHAARLKLKGAPQHARPTRPVRAHG